ncbi:trypsin-like peptidase domain-containing protein [Streptomyces sp. B6B3]|uniref:trypsin-like peptidase domain-containing protein n=1 Tax=Streptomyces sp. B6B3 TaxID=3153570 RepID=UPI00325E22A9
MDKGKSDSWGSPGQSQGEAPDPRHAEEPYGTPPYGQPGPWAPAPPVQRPDPTPAAGTPLAPREPADAPPAGSASEPRDAVPSGPPAGPPAAEPPNPARPHPGATPAGGTPYPSGATPAGGTPYPPGGTPAGGTALPGGVTPPGGTPRPAAGMTPPGGTALHAPAGMTPPGGTVTGGAPPGAGPYAPPAQHAAGPGTTTLPGEPLQRYDPWGATNGGGIPLPGPQAPEGGREPLRLSRARLLVGAAAIALLAGLLGGAVGVQMERNGGGEVELPQARDDDREIAEGSIAGIAEDVLPGVVTLHASGAEAATTGTGFVLDEEGRILTNAHVVSPAADGGGVIEVTFSSGDTAQAEVVGHDTGYDLAVVQVEGVSGLSPLELGDSDSVRVGDPVVAFGAPFDLEGTVTSGIISATERPITAGGAESDGSDISYVNALQTDAPINPGNSGGPLVDINGRVIGINSAIRNGDSDSGMDTGSGSVGLGFAIPINTGRDVAEQLINVGYATHPVIGVMLDTGYLGEGARVGSTTGDPAVTPGGPAESAGVRDGDIITAVDGEPVRSGDELIIKVRSHEPGDVVQLTIDRDGEEITIDVRLGAHTCCCGWGAGPPGRPATVHSRSSRRGCLPSAAPGRYRCHRRMCGMREAGRSSGPA